MLVRAFSQATKVSKKVAVILSGCGVYDGSEITESVAVLVHLSRAGAQAQCFAPDVPHLHVVHHILGEPRTEDRSVLAESARIARGNCKPLSILNSDHFDALIFPGGFGAAKNLSTFATNGANMTVIDDVRRVIHGFHRAGKPMGFCCIAPVLAAQVLGQKSGGKGVQLTLGMRQNNEHWPFNGAIGAAESFGNELVEKDVNTVHVDSQNKVVSTPAYMKGTAASHEVFDGIGELVRAVLKLA